MDIGTVVSLFEIALGAVVLLPMEIADPILNPGHSREYSRAPVSMAL